jgi:hypothetical protein
MSLHERTPLKNKQTKERFFILTKYDRPEEPPAERKLTRRKSQNALSEQVKHESNMIQSLAILHHTELAVNDIISRATTEENITPLIMAFCIVGDVYRNIELTRVKSFEESPHYVLSEIGPRAISEDQLCLDMLKFPGQYKTLASVLIYLHSLESPMHTIIQKHQLKIKNESDSFFDRWMTPFHTGFYYKLLVNFAQTKPKCAISHL